jgi:hypothetical protein
MKRESKFETRHLKQSKRGEETIFKCLVRTWSGHFGMLTPLLMYVGPEADELQLLTIIGFSLDMVDR